MPKYTIHSTKEDYEYQYDKLEELEENLNKTFKWKKIKSASYDQLELLVSMLERQLETKKKKVEGIIEKLKGYKITTGYDFDADFIIDDNGKMDCGSAESFEEFSKNFNDHPIEIQEALKNFIKSMDHKYGNTHKYKI